MVLAVRVAGQAVGQVAEDVVQLAGDGGAGGQRVHDDGEQVTGELGVSSVVTTQHQSGSSE